VLFDAIFLTLFFLTWTIEGGLVWLGWSIRRRAYGAIWALPFALLGGAAGGVLVPVLGLDNGVGVGVSTLTAPLGGALLMGAAYRVWDDFALGERFAFLMVRPLDEAIDASDDAAPTETADMQQASDDREPSIDSAATSSADMDEPDDQSRT
jgi:hypothetical protein